MALTVRQRGSVTEPELMSCAAAGERSQQQKLGGNYPVP